MSDKIAMNLGETMPDPSKQIVDPVKPPTPGGHRVPNLREAMELRQQNNELRTEVERLQRRKEEFFAEFAKDNDMPGNLMETMAELRKESEHLKEVNAELLRINGVQADHLRDPLRREEQAFPGVLLNVDGQEKTTNIQVLDHPTVLVARIEAAMEMAKLGLKHETAFHPQHLLDDAKTFLSRQFKADLPESVIKGAEKKELSPADEAGVKQMMGL